MRKDFSARKQEIASNKWVQSSKIEPKGLVAGPLRTDAKSESTAMVIRIIADGSPTLLLGAQEYKVRAVARLPVGSWKKGISVIKRRVKTVLCIGNDPVRLNLRCSLLTEQGWNVLSSGYGQEGIIRFAQEVVDAVVVDLNNGGAESALIMGELKRLRPEIPVILLTTAGRTGEGSHPAGRMWSSRSRKRPVSWPMR